MPTRDSHNRQGWEQALGTTFQSPPYQRRVSDPSPLIWELTSTPIVAMNTAKALPGETLFGHSPILITCVISRNKNLDQIFFIIIYAYFYAYILVHIHLRMIRLCTHISRPKLY